MAGRFENKVVLITGGGTGIGRGIARRFGQEGAEVIVVGRRPEPLHQVVHEITEAGGKAWSQTCDVLNIAEIQAVVDSALARSGRIDVLVNNAGVAGEGGFLEMTPENYDEVLGVNLRGPYFFAQRAAQAMIDGGVSGSIINITSIDASASNGPFSTYCASKAGLVNLTRCMAWELAPHKIRVNSVAPGFTETEMVASFTAPDVFEYMKTSFDRVPLRRMGTVDECAALVAFLASDEASYITGENITIDGGLTATLFVYESFALRNQST